MIDDPIVDEVHKARERILEEYGAPGSLRSRLREIEKNFGVPVVRLQARKPTETSKKAS